MSVELSYILPCSRAYYASRLLSEITKKTSLPYELFIWMNVSDDKLEKHVQSLISAGYPIRIVGKTPENIGLESLRLMIEEASGNLLIQLEDNVLFVSRKAGEVARGIFGRRKDIGMLSAEVWQDEFSSGGHPRPACYTCADTADQLYEGHIDGGFNIYPRSSVPLLLQSNFKIHFGIGSKMKARLNASKIQAYKCRRMRIFQVVSARYHSIFQGALELEMAKCKREGRDNMISAYEKEMADLPERAILKRRLMAIKNYHNSFSG